MKCIYFCFQVVGIHKFSVRVLCGYGSGMIAKKPDYQKQGRRQEYFKGRALGGSRGGLPSYSSISRGGSWTPIFGRFNGQNERIFGPGACPLAYACLRPWSKVKTTHVYKNDNNQKCFWREYNICFLHFPVIDTGVWVIPLLFSMPIAVKLYRYNLAFNLKPSIFL